MGETLAAAELWAAPETQVSQAAAAGSGMWARPAAEETALGPADVPSARPHTRGRPRSQRASPRPRPQLKPLAGRRSRSSAAACAAGFRCRMESADPPALPPAGRRPGWPPGPGSGSHPTAWSPCPATSPGRSGGLPPLRLLRQELQPPIGPGTAPAHPHGRRLQLPRVRERALCRSSTCFLQHQKIHQRGPGRASPAARQADDCSRGCQPSPSGGGVGGAGTVPQKTLQSRALTSS